MHLETLQSNNAHPLINSEFVCYYVICVDIESVHASHIIFVFRLAFPLLYSVALIHRIIISLLSIDDISVPA